MASQTTNVPNEFTVAQFQNGCAEASEIGLPPGVAPAKIILTDGFGNRLEYTFRHRETNNDGETTAWVYGRIFRDGPYQTLSILND